MTDAAYAQKVHQFVSAGGSVVFGAQSGAKTVDGHTVSLPLPGLFAELAGIEIEDWTMLPGDEKRPATINGLEHAIEFGTFVEKLKLLGAKAIAHWSTNDSLLAGGVAISVNQVGRGKVYYIGGYSPPDAVTALSGYFAQSLGLTQTISATADVECVVRESGTARYTCLLNHGAQAQEVKLVPSGVDRISGRAIDGSITLEPLDVIVIESPRQVG
jgi:beta-galactosidase